MVGYDIIPFDNCTNVDYKSQQRNPQKNSNMMFRPVLSDYLALQVTIFSSSFNSHY
jgi:hypothetical protein